MKSNSNIHVYREDTGETIYKGHNIITDISRWLFAQLAALTAPISLSPPQDEPVSIPAVPVAWGVWGLALGAGSPAWGITPPPETASQFELFQPVARVQLSRVNFVTQDSQGNFNPVATLATSVDFQTTVNATQNGLQGIGIKEMGLIGGGTASMSLPSAVVNMGNAPFFNGNPASYATVAASQQTVVLLNYKTLPSLLLPPGVNVIFSWVFQF